jgi:Spy/CpxP family protein refolding chaperone
MRTLVLVAGALLGATPVVLAAQLMPTRVIRRGAGLGFELSDGEPISFFLENSKELGLSDEQKDQLIDIRRRLRRTNAPFMRQLDSLRESLGISLEPRPRLIPGEVEAFQRLQLLSQPIVDSMRVNNQTAQAEARAILRDHQRATLDSLVIAARDSSRGRGRRPPGSPR